MSNRILAIKLRALGDTILLTGSLNLLKEHFPRAEIDVLVPKQWAPVLEGLDFINQVIPWDDGDTKWSSVLEFLRQFQRLRKRCYDATLAFHATPKTAWLAQLVKKSGGLAVSNSHDLFNRNTRSDREVPGRGYPKANIDRDLDILRAMGEEVEVVKAMPLLKLRNEEIQSATKLLMDQKGTRGGPLYFLGLGASRDTKRWSPLRMAEFVKLVLRKTPHARFVCCTLPSDREWWERFKREFPNKECIFHFDSLSIRDAMGLLSLCNIYVGNDSGLKHMAVALKIPTVTLFGPESPLEWHPYPLERNPILYIEKMDCRTSGGNHWCSIPICTVAAHQCMQSISAEEVYNRVEPLLR